MSRGRWLRSRRARVAAGVVLAIGVVVARAGVVWFRGDGGPPETQDLGGVVVERRWTLDLPARERSDELFEGDVPLVAIDGEEQLVGFRVLAG